jgi:hypothetical protein
MDKNAPALDAPLSEIEFASLGEGEVAYIREMSSDEARELFPDVKIPEGIEIFAVHGADGRPLVLTGTRPAAIGSVREQNLELVSIH